MYFQKRVSCLDCTRKINPISTYCPWCGVLYKLENKNIFKGLRRSTYLYCKYCLHTAEHADHVYCADCGLKYRDNCVSRL